MKPKDIINNYHYEKLSSKHDLSEFSCGVKDLDDFLKDDALMQQEQNLSVTYLAIYENKILGYVSILADKVDCNRINKRLTIYSQYPSVKIGRLAVDKKYQKYGIGSAILTSTSLLIKEMSKDLGIAFITIDAYCIAKNFYLKNSFKKMKVHDIEKLKRASKHDNTTSIPMYKSIKKIKI